MLETTYWPVYTDSLRILKALQGLLPIHKRLAISKINSSLTDCLNIAESDFSYGLQNPFTSVLLTKNPN